MREIFPIKPAKQEPLSACPPIPPFSTSVRIIATFSARHSTRLKNINTNGSPFAVTDVVFWFVSNTVNSSKVGDYLFVRSRQVLEFLNFIKNTASGVRKLLQAVVRDVNSFRLHVLWA